MRKGNIMRPAKHHNFIKSPADLADCLRAGPFTSMGSCNVYLWTNGGDIVSFKGARESFKDEAIKILNKDRGAIAFCDIYWEGPTETCAITGEPCPSTYGDPDETT
jgi:hypothetical protein